MQLKMAKIPFSVDKEAYILQQLRFSKMKVIIMTDMKISTPLWERRTEMPTWYFVRPFFKDLFDKEKFDFKIDFKN